MLEGRIQHSVVEPGLGLADGLQSRIAVHMASARAIAELTHGVQETRHCLRMLDRHIVLSVTTRATSGTGRCRPRNLVRIGGMTGHTGQRHFVVAGIAPRCVHKAQHGPIRIAVARGAIKLRGHVRGRHTQRNGIVVASRTVADQFRVIELGWFPPERAMAGIALSRRRHVIARHAGRAQAVVTGLTGARHDAGVIKARRRPGVGRMTGLAGIATGNVVLALALRHGAIVAAHASA